MPTAFRFARFLTAVPAAIAMASCGTPSIAPPLGHSVSSARARAAQPMRLKHAGSIVYVGSVGGFIDVFTLVKGQYQKTMQISDSNGPEGIHTDSAANMYVADQGLSSYGEPEGDIAIYPKGATYPKREIVPGYNVSDVLPIGVESSMYASNFGQVGSGFGPGSLSYYRPGANEPQWTKTIAGAFQAWGLVRDPSSKDVFVSYSIGYLSTGGGELGRSARGKGQVKPIVALATADGLAEDGSGDLLAASGGNILILSQKGKTLRTIAVPGSAYRMAFNKDYSLLYVTNFDDYDVEIFSYPKGKLVGTITSPDWGDRSWTDGIAVWPPPKQ